MTVSNAGVGRQSEGLKVGTLSSQMVDWNAQLARRCQLATHVK